MLVVIRLMKKEPSIREEGFILTRKSLDKGSAFIDVIPS